MTKFFRTALAFSLVACAGEAGDLFPADAGPELGQVAFATTRTGSYGIETDCGGDGADCDDSTTISQTGAKCIVPWQNNFCHAVSSKVRRIGFAASTCSSWWQARFVEVYNEFNWNHGDYGWAWAEGNQEGGIRCNGTLPDGSSMSSSMLGATWFDAPFSDASQWPNGTLRRWSKSQTRINTVAMEALPSWAGKTDTQRKRAARSNIRHELYHAMGVAHNTTPGSLMYPTFDEAHYYADIQLRTEERDSFNAYVP